MQTSKKSDKYKLAKEFEQLEKKNISNRLKHNIRFNHLKEEADNHKKTVNSRLEKFIPSQNK